jgi:CheY-like chemotaxis protein
VRNRARKVLIVDDHEELRTSVARLVRAWGHEVAVAGDGPTALAVAQSFQPDVAVLDVLIPGITGPELARQLRAIPLSTRPFLIAMTADGDPLLQKACLDGGFDAYVAKRSVLDLEALLRRSPS